ncbi:MAG: UDP-N-acetylmuramate dehydrogenase [Bacteroidales bacterium]|nr:UDP-N-acetylmuramate dehydrogenase [Bacteroidales bacterium]
MIRFTENASLLPYNTFGIAAKAALLVEYNQEEDLPTIFQDPRVKGKPFLHVGQGSNLLFTQDYPGVILHGSIKGIKLNASGDEEQLVEVGAGEVWDHLCQWAAIRGFMGIENLSGIPGEVGAAAVQNIGAYGAEFKDVCVAVAVYDVQQSKNYIVGVEDCRYGYRTSIFKDAEFKSRFVITGVLLRLRTKALFNIEYGNIKAALLERGYSLQQKDVRTSRRKPSKVNRPITLSAMRETILAIRSAKLPDPAIYGNAGSFFKNPVIPIVKYRALHSQYPDIPMYAVTKPNGEQDPNMVKVPAGWLIEHSGCATRRVGDAAVYPKQCLVLVNMGKAKSQEVVQLANIIIETVLDRFDVQLEPEVNFI